MLTGGFAVSGKKLFTFAVFGDTHVNQEETRSSSPYACNALSNGRARFVVAEINKAQPAFAVHLGDMVNPVPELPTYDRAVQNFKSISSQLRSPLFMVAGNHDIGDKHIAWAPAVSVTEENLARFSDCYGRDFYSVDTNGIHLIVLNALVMNSGLRVEQDQRNWLKGDLKANHHKRVFIFIHYPPFVSDPQERDSYDNIDEPGRSWLLDLLRRYSPEALFCGHVHNFWYNQFYQTELYTLPSTAFVRFDYGELFHTASGPEAGRDDTAKLGYALVDVYEYGHVVRYIRTYGKVLGPDRDPEPKIEVMLGVPPKLATQSSVSIDMRQPWAEELEITPSGAIDEFERKLARNDYPVQALWEMGVGQMRVPAQDLRNPRLRERMEQLSRVGHSFQIYFHGLPTTDDMDLLCGFDGSIHWIEIILRWENIQDYLDKLTELKARVGRPVLLSRTNRKHGAGSSDGGQFNHLIEHGFAVAELREFVDKNPTCPIDGFMFSLPRDLQPRSTLLSFSEFASSTKRKACAYLKTTSRNPAEYFADERENACRFAEAIFMCIGLEDVSVVLDTFADIDRGYFARPGLVDRTYNPKVGSRVVGALLAALRGRDWRLILDSFGKSPNDDSIRIKASDGSTAELLGQRAVIDRAAVSMAEKYIALDTGNCSSSVPDMDGTYVPIILTRLVGST